MVEVVNLSFPDTLRAIYSSLTDTSRPDGTRDNKEEMAGLLYIAGRFMY